MSPFLDNLLSAPSPSQKKTPESYLSPPPPSTTSPFELSVSATPSQSNPIFGFGDATEQPLPPKRVVSAIPLDLQPFPFPSYSFVGMHATRLLSPTSSSREASPQPAAPTHNDAGVAVQPNNAGINNGRASPRPAENPTVRNAPAPPRVVAPEETIPVNSPQAQEEVENFSDLWAQFNEFLRGPGRDMLNTNGDEMNITDLEGVPSFQEIAPVMHLAYEQLFRELALDNGNIDAIGGGAQGTFLGQNLPNFMQAAPPPVVNAPNAAADPPSPVQDKQYSDYACCVDYELKVGLFLRILLLLALIVKLSPPLSGTDVGQ